MSTVPRVGYDVVPLSLSTAGEYRYASQMARALGRLADVSLHPLTFAARRPGTLAQRVAYQAFAEGVFYPVLAPRKARRSALDLVHFPRHLVTPGRSMGRPSVVTLHDVLPFSHPEYFSGIISRHHRLLTGPAARRADRVLTGSQHSRSEIAERLGVSVDRIDVTPYGVDERFAPTEAHPGWLGERFGIEPPYVLSVGTVEPRKNLQRLVEAMDLVAGHEPGTTLVLIGGTGWKTAEIEASIQRSRAPVVRTGFVEDRELVSLYAGAACFAYPSLAEGFGFPVLEAMACGTPVLTSDRSSLPELVGNAGVIVDPTSVEAMAEGIRGLLGSTERQTRAALGIRRAAEFTWEGCARATAASYRCAIGEASERAPTRS